MPDVITDDTAELGAVVHTFWVARLAEDPLLAAMAMAASWETHVVVEIVWHLRRLGATLEPEPPDLKTARAGLAKGVAALRDPNLSAPLLAALQGVPKWNADATAAIATASLRPLIDGKADEVAYWSALDAATELTKRINKQTNLGKAAIAKLEALPWMQAAKQLRQAVAAVGWSLAVEVARAAQPAVARQLAAARLITQDGLIEAMYHALHRDGEGAASAQRLASHLGDKFHVALIDESQDTDARQFAIFRRIFLDRDEPRRLILVGDPKQAIFGFRGADVSTYLEAREQAPRAFTLTRTYRAPPRLVDGVNALFDVPRSFHQAGMEFRPAVSALTEDRQLVRSGEPSPRLECWVADEGAANPFGQYTDRTTETSRRVATTIVDLLEHGEIWVTPENGGATTTEAVRCSDFAVLVATNRQATAMVAALQERGVPTVVNSGDDVFRSDEALELKTLLRAIAEPRPRRLRAALATRLLGLTASDLERLNAEEASADGATPTGLTSFDTWSERFLRWNALWTTRGFAPLVAELDASEVAISHRLAVLPLTGERRITNYRHLTDLLLEAARHEAPRPAELVRWLGQQIARAEDRAEVEEHQLQLATDRAAVQVVTMHKAKGLEYPLVFAPYLADSLRAPEKRLEIRERDAAGKLRDILVNLELVDTVTKERRIQQNLTAELEERLRLAYVAVTRAQVKAWILSVSGGKKSSALDWLLRAEVERGLYPMFSPQWMEAAKTNRAARHTAALRERGAVPVGKNAATAALAFGSPPASKRDRYQHTTETVDGRELAAASTPRIPPSWRVTSFSTLTREKHVHGRSDTASQRPENLTEALVPDSRAALLFLAAPGGAAVGTAVHEWIETWDFRGPDREAVAAHAVASRLAPLADGPGWDVVMTELFETLRDVRLPGAETAPLADWCSEAHASEWHFHLPLAGAVGVADFARCFAEHGAPEHRAYAGVLAALGEERFHGLLQGFIDRLVRPGAAWGVIDWKTNHLGPTLAHYGPSALLQCAIDEHYLLQTHLYLVALRRYVRALGQPLHLAGAWLVFLRGIVRGSDAGVLHVNPPVAMLDALDRLFAPERSAGS
jgi:exodeoxyribonuclease V beta subunit